jgi:glycosidase
MKPLVLLLAAALLNAAPVVTKVDPPNWWTGFSINPVRVLIRGTGLTGARVTATEGGIQPGAVRVNAAGTYLFVDVRVSKPGQHGLRITTADGVTFAPFDVLPPLPRKDRFQGFSPDDVIYLILPDRFSNGDPSNDDPPVSKGLFDRSKPRYYHGGDLQGILNHLPYLEDLGITTLWIAPLYDNVNHLNEREKYDGQPITDYHGYGAVDFYSVDEHFGTLDKFRELVDAAHKGGLRVILDMVANHTGPYHPWVADPPTPNWFHGTVSNHLKESWQTWTLLDPHSTPEFQRPTLDGWFLDILPDLNQDDPEVARYLIQNTLWWVASSGIDGIRQDTLPYVPRTFWRDWTKALKREYPNLRVIGEVFDSDPALASFFQGGKPRFDGVDSGIDTVFDFPLYSAIRHVFIEGKPMQELGRVLAHDTLYTNPDLLVTFLGLHDVTRFLSEPGATVEGMKLALAFLMTVRGVPMLYYGDEIGMLGGNDPDNRRDFPGGWKEDPRNAFTASGLAPQQEVIFEQTRKLAQLRAVLPEMRRGPLIELAVADSTYAYRRGNAIVAFNNGPSSANLDLEAEDGHWQFELGGTETLAAVNGNLHLSLPAHTAAILTHR